jgi:hypothetical protein
MNIHFTDTKTREILRWTLQNYYSELSIYHDSALNTFDRLVVWVKTQGPVKATERCKIARLALTKYLAGEPLVPPVGVSLTHDKIPKIFRKELRDLIRARNPRGVSMCLTLLSSTRILLGGKPVDYSPIVDPWKGKIPRDVESFIPKFCKWACDQPIPTDWDSFHFTTKAGPNGPAIAGSVADFEAMPESLLSNVCTLGGEPLDAILFFYVYRKGTKVLDFLKRVLGYTSTRVPGFRKISIKRDRETKSRIFAILDYWSQASLWTLHKNLFKILKRLPRDFTFDQGKGLDLKRTNDSAYSSFDLSNATDRFPLLLQEKILTYWIGEAKAKAWKEIIVGFEFRTPEGKSIAYATGQPMGAHSSWATFALCHHLVVQAAAQRVRKFPFAAYSLLGDDIVIADDQVSREYKCILEELDVPISAQKTHTSKTMYEFAKRWMMDDTEVTPFPLSGLVETHKKYHLLYELLKQAELRNLHTSWFRSNPVELLKLWKISGIVGRQAQRFLKHFRVLAILPFPGNIVEDEGISARRVSEILGVTLSCNISPPSCSGILDRMAIASYTFRIARTAEKSLSLVIGWSEMFQELIEKDTSLGSDDRSALLDNALESVASFNLMSRKAQEALDSIGPGKAFGKGEIWSTLRRSQILILPTASGINPTRSSHLYIGAKATLVRDLEMTWKRYLLGLRPAESRMQRALGKTTTL